MRDLAALFLLFVTTVAFWSVLYATGLVWLFLGGAGVGVVLWLGLNRIRGLMRRPYDEAG